MVEWWWLSTERMTVAVEVYAGTVTDGPPIMRRFIGLPTQQLGRWLRRQGGFRCERLA